MLARTKEFDSIKNPRFTSEDSLLFINHINNKEPFSSRREELEKRKKLKDNRVARLSQENKLDQPNRVLTLFSHSPLRGTKPECDVPQVNPTSYIAGPGIVISSPPSPEKGTISLAAINPSPAGNYYNMNASVNHQGQIILASNGTRGTLTSITCGYGLDGGVITEEGVISITKKGITSELLADAPSTLKPGSYTSADITVNEKGLIVSATNGSVLTKVNCKQGLSSAVDSGTVTLEICPSLELTGIPTAPTPLAGNNSNQIATTSFVNTAVANAIQAIIAAVANTK